MHGSKRKTTPATDAELEASRNQASEGWMCLDEILMFKSVADLSLVEIESILLATGKLLKINPEIGTAWNLRRRAFLALEKDKRNNLLREEISILDKLMKLAIKSYSVWSHRKWCIEIIMKTETDEGERNKFIRNELWCSEKLLKEFDGRNFHCWNYRTFLSNFLEKTLNFQENIRLSKELIEKDFSNYSAWNIRARAVMDYPGNVSADEEFSLVRNALFTEPGDQSVWQYRQFLLDKIFPGFDDDATIEELLSVEANCKYALISKAKNAANISENERLHIWSVLLPSIDPMRTGYYMKNQKRLLY